MLFISFKSLMYCMALLHPIGRTLVIIASRCLLGRRYKDDVIWYKSEKYSYKINRMPISQALFNETNFVIIPQWMAILGTKVER